MSVLVLTANQTGRTITLQNSATPTGYSFMSDSDFGNAEWQVTYGGARGRLGPLPAYALPQARQVTHHMRVYNAASKDAQSQLLEAAYVVAEDVRRFGGSMLWKSAGQTYRQIFDVLTLQHDILWGGNNGENLLRAEFNLVMACAPYVHGDPMDTLDDFSTNTITAGNYTFDASAATISSGVLHPTSGTLLRMRNTLKGYRIGDLELTKKIVTTGSTAASTWGVAARVAVGGADTCITAEINPNGSTIKIRKYVAGTGSDLASTSYSTSLVTTVWLRLRIEGMKVTAEGFNTNAPTPVATPTASVTYTMTPAEASLFAPGDWGIRATPGANETYDDLSCMPYTYRLINAPEHLALVGAIPGDVAAQADIQITPFGGSASPVFGMVGTLERPLNNNLCWNGDFESSTLGAAGWVATAVSGVIAAATSVSRDSSSALVKYGLGDLSIVCPATTDTGASFLISRRFRRGCTYALLLYAKSASQTTLARCKLGVSGDLATGTSTALSAGGGWYSVTWTPTADHDFAYLAFGIAAATATTMNIDAVNAVETVMPMTLASGTSSGATSLPVNSVSTDIPPAFPFLAMVDQELVRVTASSVGALAVDPGVEGSIQTTHSTGAQVVVLPPLRREFEGAGAFEPMDIIEAEAYVSALSSVTGTFAPDTPSATYRGGLGMVWSGMTAGATGTFAWLVDPSLIVPDDYTLGEVDVEVWVRWATAIGQTSLKVDAVCLPDGGSTKGAQRFTRETDSKLRTLPTSGTPLRFSRIGTLPMIVDKSNPLRWQLLLNVTPGSQANFYLDYLLLVPIRYRVAGPTRKANDTASTAGAYPPFIPYDAGWGSTSAMMKTLRADGSCFITEIGKTGYPDHGLGRLIEIPAGDCDLICKTSNLVPDDPTADATVEMFSGAPSYTQTVHVSVTPRYALIRGS